MSEYIKAGFDLAAVTALLGWAADALPALATGLTVVWSLIRIWETSTVQRWWFNRQLRK